MSDELKLLEDRVPEAPAVNPWLVLVVDDEEEVHAVTALALREFSYAGRGLKYLHAYSAAQACTMIAASPEVALILLDVVMESDRAGLDVVRFVREQLKNPFVRIILRTGQPGQAPELEVLSRYDINDYKQKTELTRERLVTTVYTSLSVYRDLRALDASRHGLEKVIESSARIFELRSMEQFTQGVLEQLTALLYLDHEAVVVRTSGLAAQEDHHPHRILAGTGAFAPLVGRVAEDVLPLSVLARLEEARDARSSVYGVDYFAGCYPGNEDLIFYIGADHPLRPPDRKLIELFCRNVGIARDNLRRFASEP